MRIASVFAMTNSICSLINEPVCPIRKSASFIRACCISHPIFAIPNNLHVRISSQQIQVQKAKCHFKRRTIKRNGENVSFIRKPKELCPKAIFSANKNVQKGMSDRCLGRGIVQSLSHACITMEHCCSKHFGVQNKEFYGKHGQGDIN